MIKLILFFIVCCVVFLVHVNKENDKYFDDVTDAIKKANKNQ